MQDGMHDVWLESHSHSHSYSCDCGCHSAESRLGLLSPLCCAVRSPQLPLLSRSAPQWTAGEGGRNRKRRDPSRSARPGAITRGGTTARSGGGRLPPVPDEPSVHPARPHNCSTPRTASPDDIQTRLRAGAQIAHGEAPTAARLLCIRHTHLAASLLTPHACCSPSN